MCLHVTAYLQPFVVVQVRICIAFTAELVKVWLQVACMEQFTKEVPTSKVLHMNKTC